MTDPSNSERVIHFLVIAAALVIIIGGINQAQTVLVSFLVAFSSPSSGRLRCSGSSEDEFLSLLPCSS